MALAAAQVVDAVAARLAPTVAAGRVYTDRAWPIAAEQLPAWMVLAADEQIDQQTLGNDIERHELGIECRGLVSAVAGIDDAMNNLAAAGLTAVHAAPYTGFALRSESIERAMSSQAGADIAAVTVRLRAVFFTNASAPETLL